MKVTTRRFAQLLRDAQAWDSRYKAMCHAQTEWLLTNFCFADNFCAYATLEDRQRWDVPKFAGKYPFTNCD